MDSIPATATPRSCILLKKRLRCPWHQRVRVRPHPEIAALYVYVHYCRYLFDTNLDRVPATAMPHSYIVPKKQSRCRWHQRERVRLHPELTGAHGRRRLVKRHHHES